MKSHVQMLQSFRRRLEFLLMFRGAVRWTTLWFFIWGVVVLAARISHVVVDNLDEIAGPAIPPLLVRLSAAGTAGLVVTGGRRLRTVLDH